MATSTWAQVSMWFGVKNSTAKSNRMMKNQSLTVMTKRRNLSILGRGLPVPAAMAFLSESRKTRSRYLMFMTVLCRMGTSTRKSSSRMRVVVR